jgi:hypothetical protein
MQSKIPLLRITQLIFFSYQKEKMALIDAVGTGISIFMIADGCFWFFCFTFGMFILGLFLYRNRNKENDWEQTTGIITEFTYIKTNGQTMYYNVHYSYSPLVVTSTPLLLTKVNTNKAYYDGNVPIKGQTDTIWYRISDPSDVSFVSPMSARGKRDWGFTLMIIGALLSIVWFSLFISLFSPNKYESAATVFSFFAFFHFSSQFIP